MREVFWNETRFNDAGNNERPFGRTVFESGECPADLLLSKADVVKTWSQADNEEVARLDGLLDFVLPVVAEGEITLIQPGLHSDSREVVEQ